MIVYCTDKMLNVLGFATTNLKSKFHIIEDEKTEDAETGTATFEMTVAFNDDNRKELEQFLAVGNCLLRSEMSETESRYSIDSSRDFFTIIESEINVKERTINVYAEDGGMDLINDIAPALDNSNQYDVATYLRLYLTNSGWEIGVNEIPDKRVILSFSGEETVSERLKNIAKGFDADITFTFIVDGLRVSKRYVNILNNYGNETDRILYLGKDVENITVNKSIAELATALYPTGADGLTLSGYTYDDGDFFVNGSYLYSREAVAEWNRYSFDGDNNGHFFRYYSTEAKTKLELCNQAIEQLKELREPKVVYEATIRRLGVGIGIRDRINIVDEKGEIYLSAKIVQLQTSVCNGERKVTLGDYIEQESGISKKVEELAVKFSQIAENRNYVLTITSSGGVVKENIGDQPLTATLTAHLYKNAVEVTELEDGLVLQWYKDGAKLTGATGFTYNASTSVSASYACKLETEGI